MVLKTESDIVNDALVRAGIKAVEEGAAAAFYQDGKRELVRMIKEWQATGAHLWTRRTGYLFFQPSQNKYTIPGTDKATESFVETTLSVAGVATDTSITVTASTGMAVNDEIGIKLDDGTIDWFTIASITPTVAPAATIAFSSGSLASAAAVGSEVYAFTTAIGKMLRVTDARRASGTGTTLSEVSMMQTARIDYLNLPNKNSAGTPVQFYYNPNITNGDMYVWPTPTSTDTYGSFTYYSPISEFATSATDADFPDEWISALVWNLAARLTVAILGKEPAPSMLRIARSTYDTAFQFDQGDESLYFEYSPMRRG